MQVANLGGEFFPVTVAERTCAQRGAGPTRGAGIVEVNAAGDAWRIVWGFKNGGVPTSEFPSHAAIQSVRREATGGTGRVLYHAHPANVVALTNAVVDARTFTRALWKMLMEAMIAFPTGIGVVPWMVPGGPEIASATADAMRVYDACVWAHHGLFCAGNDFDSTFGLAQTIDKAATVDAAGAR